MAAPRDRLFYSFPDLDNKSDEETKQEKSQLISYIRQNILGNKKQFSGPFGLREALYLDFTASGKSLSFIEDYIRDQVLPEYGNTHTTTSVTSLQTTLYRHEARDIVRNAVHASEHDAVIFVGSGSTAAVHKLIYALDLKTSPVVIVSPYEHHSNLLPWKEIGAKVLRVKADSKGLVDQAHLIQLLQRWKDCGRQIIGCFSAASNISGILVDVDNINVILHKHGALAFWDYATAAPYIQIDMNPVSASCDQPYMYKDAVFVSCHKFVGGVQTPGILIAKKKLFKNHVPGGCGGGSVFFVRREDHRYLQEPELKEEGGTPAIIESIRAGLVFQLKQAVSTSVIMEREEYLFRRAREAWKNHPSLILLGNMDVARLPIFSFMVYHKGSGRFLHHNFVSVLLNDLFGIQARGGCACAGPYAMDLLGMEEEMSKKIENLLAEDSRLDRTHLRRYREYSQREILRPGFTRINLPYFMDNESLEFVLEAVKIVAEDGWKLLPQYMFNPETGEWRQINFQVFKDRKWLGHISYSSGEMAYKVPAPVVKGPLPENFDDCLQKARDLCQKSSKTKFQLADHSVMFDEESQTLRWFTLPSEAYSCLQGKECNNSGFTLPFCPPRLREQIGMPKFVGNYDENDDIDTGLDGLKESTNDAVKNGERAEERINGENKSEIKRFSDGFQDCLERGFACDRNAGKTDRSDRGDNKESVITEHCSVITDSVLSHQHTDRETAGTELKQANEKSVITEQVNRDATGTDGKQVNTDSTQLGGSAETIRMSENIENYKTGNATENVQSSHSKSDNATEHLTSSQTVKSSSTLSSESSPTCDESAIATDKNTENGTLKDKNVDETSIVNGIDCDQKSGKSQPGVSCSDLVCRKRPVDTAADSKHNSKVQKVKENGETGSKHSAEKNAEKADKKAKKNKWCSPPKSIFTPFLKATEEYNMLQNGDHVLICLSGGKDSLSLLHTVHQYMFYCKKKGINFKLGAVTVDPQTPSYDPSPLKLYLASLGVPYFYESQGILEQASNLPYECASICSFCSRMKRGRIYACARREGYNVLALGQHLDDLCESHLKYACLYACARREGYCLLASGQHLDYLCDSFMMSVFHNGNLRTMKAHYTVEEGDLRVIRPLVYVREKDLRTFAEQSKLPVIAENCPACFEAPKERHRIKQLLAAQEIMFPRIYPSMLSAIKPIMAINKTQISLSDMIQGKEDESVDDIDI